MGYKLIDEDVSAKDLEGMVWECYSYDGSLEEYYYYENDEEFFTTRILGWYDECCTSSLLWALQLHRWLC